MGIQQLARSSRKESKRDPEGIRKQVDKLLLSRGTCGSAEEGTQLNNDSLPTEMISFTETT